MYEQHELAKQCVLLGPMGSKFPPLAALHKLLQAYASAQMMCSLTYVPLCDVTLLEAGSAHIHMQKSIGIAI